MRDEEKRLNKALKESSDLVKKNTEILMDLAGKFLSKGAAITPTDGQKKRPIMKM